MIKFKNKKIGGLSKIVKKKIKEMVYVNATNFNIMKYLKELV